MTEIRIDVDKKTYDLWKREATDLGIRLTQYVRMLAKGQIGQPVITAAVPVQPAGVAFARREGSIGSRLLVAMERNGQYLISEGAMVRQYAIAMGVTKPQLLGALGSLVASRRMVHRDGAYHIVGEGEIYNRVGEDTPIRGD